MLKINNLTKEYGKLVALDNFTMNINEGEIYGIIGPNGAGKTTLFKMIATLLNQTAGAIELDELTYTKNNLESIRSQIGYVPDFFGVYDNLKVSEYMDFYSELADIKKPNKKVVIKEALNTVFLFDKVDSYVNDLSRGMKQRLCLARALINSPKLLVLDEPASGMDPISRAKMKEILLRLKKSGKTIIISSHILNELSQICTHVVILDSGKIAIQGAIDDIMNKIEGEEVIVLDVLNDISEKQYIIKDFPGVRDVTTHDSVYHITFNGDRSRKSMLLRHLIDNGVHVVSFKNQVSNIEDIYNKVTMGGDLNED